MSDLLNEFILGVNTNRIKEKVIIAPCWMPESVGITYAKKIGESSCQVWECMIDKKTFTYIVTGVGAATCMDVVMALKDTICNQILFIGSAGALRVGINIGDFAVPKEIISAEGASRYIGNNLDEDVFGKHFDTSNELQHRLIDCLNNKLNGLEICAYEGIGISVESILLQYNHIDEFVNMKCDFVDMESSAFLAACSAANFHGAVIFCISDNILQDEPLYKVSFDKTDYRKKVRKKIMPLVLREFVYGFRK